MDKTTTDFGYQQVPLEDKVRLVGKVFSSVASRYDIMNDLMSFGIHRIWKKIAVQHCAIKPSQVILDLAGGTGDLTQAFVHELQNFGHVVLADINAEMLQAGRSKLINRSIIKQVDYYNSNSIKSLKINNLLLN